MGSVLSQTFVINSLYRELCTLVHRSVHNTATEADSREICLLAMNCILYLSFSFQRKLMISENFINDLLLMKNYASVPINSYPYRLRYNCLEALEMLISNNRFDFWYFV